MSGTPCGCPSRGCRTRRALAAVAALAVYHGAIRSRLLRWGATDAESLSPLPGDGIVPEPRTATTRAVTVEARPGEIWPWLVQMGHGRGGLYRYDMLDRLFGYTNRPSAETVLPEFQQLEVGDVIPLGRGPSWPVVHVDREKALVVEPVAGSVSWCFALLPESDETSRLVSRVRTRVGWGPLVWALGPVVDLPWFLMERRMLHGIKRRAQTLAASRAEA